MGGYWHATAEKRAPASRSTAVSTAARTVIRDGALVSKVSCPKIAPGRPVMRSAAAPPANGAGLAQDVALAEVPRLVALEVRDLAAHAALDDGEEGVGGLAGVDHRRAVRELEQLGAGGQLVERRLRELGEEGER